MDDYKQFKLKLLNDKGEIDDDRLNLWYKLFSGLWDICDDILEDSYSPNGTLPPHEEYLVDGDLIRRLEYHTDRIVEEGGR